MATVRLEGMEDVRATLSRLGSEMPSAIRNTLNDTARDVLKREQKEIERVFDRPTPWIRKAFFVEKATKVMFTAKVRPKDTGSYGSRAAALRNTLVPHVPTFASTRQAKGMAIALRAAGLLTASQFLVPSRTMKLNASGNITKTLAKKMIADVTSGNMKAKYLFLDVGGVRGIWWRTKLMAGAHDALQMVVVNRAPRYSKRFEFYAVGYDEASKVIVGHADKAVQFALNRSR